MSEFVDPNIDDKYKVIDDVLIDIKTSEPIYFIDKTKRVIKYYFYYIKDTHYFVINYFMDEICIERVSLNLKTMKKYVKSSTILLQNPIKYINNKIVFSSQWVIDDVRAFFFNKYKR